MRKKCELKEIAEDVKEILTNKPLTRDDDYLLYQYYMNKQNISVEITFRKLCSLIKDKKLPSFESVGRARRKMQELHANLRGTQYIEQMRRKEEKKYRDFAKGE